MTIVLYPSISTYTVNTRNQITGGDGATFSHDNNGNRTQRTGAGTFVEYQYDDENQLVSARTDTSGTPEGSRWRTDWTYDARGRIRLKSEYIWLSGSWYPNGTIRYVYDGMRVIQQRSSSNASQVTYTRGPDMSGTWEGAGGIGGLLARTAHSGAWGVTWTHAFYHADGNGNITFLLRMDQTLGASYRYDAYGRTLSSSGTLASANVYRFSSKELMAQSGLYYYGYRFYDPLTQRWMSRDPLGEAGGINLYSINRNNPVSNIDPLGLSSSPVYDQLNKPPLPVEIAYKLIKQEDPDVPPLKASDINPHVTEFYKRFCGPGYGRYPTLDKSLTDAVSHSVVNQALTLGVSGRVMIGQKASVDCTVRMRPIQGVYEGTVGAQLGFGHGWTVNLTIGAQQNSSGSNLSSGFSVKKGF